MDFETSKRKVAALLEPRNVVIVGASNRPGSIAAMVRRNLARYEFAGPVYLVNPGRDEIDGERCYRDLASLPEAPDHLAVLAPAPAVRELLLHASDAGARSATVFSTGFGEALDPQGALLGQQLRDVIARTGLAVSGPNCMGNLAVKSRLMTLALQDPVQFRRGPVALVGQSGGILLYLYWALAERGIAAEYMITSGNEAGLTLADYIAYFADQPALKVIVIYLEAVVDTAKFKAACRAARTAGKSVIAVKLGQSDAGREAALAHTASLTGSIQAFDAMAGEVGVVRAETLDDVVETAELLVHTGAPDGRRLGAITLSGAFRGLLLDAAEQNHLVFPPLGRQTAASLRSVLGAGTLMSNPVDGGFSVITSTETFLTCIDALNSDPDIDVILVQEALPARAGSDRAERYMAALENYITTKGTKPICYVALVSHGLTDYSLALRAKTPHLSFLHEANKSLRVIDSVVRSKEREGLARISSLAHAPPDAHTRALIAKARERAMSVPCTLNEAQSKELLRAYGIATPAERLVLNSAAAVEAATAFGYPVVLKAVSSKIAHKSDHAAVALNLNGPDDVIAAFARITDALASQGLADSLEGMLVCKQITGGAELALGLHRDQEVGPVLMAGSGGSLLELVRDVAFCVPPLNRKKALDLIERTRIARVIRGYRGGVPLDVDAAIDALIALDRISADLGDAVQSIDINPFTVLPKGQGGLALDAMIALRPPKAGTGG